jgi:hypothetical protein
VRLTDFWERLDEVLGTAYARSWAADVVITSLGSRTVREALDDGEDAQVVWRAVCEVIEVPGHLR